MGYSAWHDALDVLPSGKEREAETTDQKIAHAQVLALLALGQELDRFNVAESPMAERLLAAIEGDAVELPAAPSSTRVARRIR